MGNLMLREQQRFFLTVLLICDGLAIILSVVLAYWIRFTLLGTYQPSGATQWAFATHAIPPLLAVPIVMVTIAWSGLYRPRRDQRLFLEALSLTRAVTIAVAVTLLILTSTRHFLFESRHYSLLQFGIWWGTLWTMLLMWRTIFRSALRWIRSRGWNLRHVAIVGTGRVGQMVCSKLRENAWTGIHPEYFISHEPSPKESNCLGLEVRGGADDLDALLEEGTLSGVFLALPGEMAGQMPELLAQLEQYPIDVRVVPDMNPRYLWANLSIAELDGMWFMNVRQSPMVGWGRIAKRMMDITGSLLAITIFSLLMAIIAVVVKVTSEGPVIFRQERMTINGKRFSIMKFRSMAHVDDAGRAKRDEGGGQSAWTGRDCAEVTPVGEFLRRTSLDELPQLFNVLAGTMSLVGPRPERPELIREFRQKHRGYMMRQTVKSGMTGWAQINGLRGDTSLRKRLQYDRYYVRRWSVGFDLWILLRTAISGFIHPNAH